MRFHVHLLCFINDESQRIEKRKFWLRSDNTFNADPSVVEMKQSNWNWLWDVNVIETRIDNYSCGSKFLCNFEYFVISKIHFTSWVFIKKKRFLLYKNEIACAFRRSIFFIQFWIVLQRIKFFHNYNILEEEKKKRKRKTLICKTRV